MRDDFVWSEKYRPKKIEDIVLPSKLKALFLSMLSNGDLPNLLLVGGPGMGKTTLARAILEQLQCDYIIINGSLKNGIDVLRNEIMNFASSVSFTGGRKFVIIDEADYLNANSVQPALRNFMEEYSKNCGFILTGNYKNKIITPLRSRCTVIDFKVTKSETASLAAEFFKRVLDILDKETITYDKAVVAEIIKKFYPDFRKTLNELQTYSSAGSIDSGSLGISSDSDISPLLSSMKKKDFTSSRKWIGENIDIDQNILFRTLYDKLALKLTPASFAQIILILADYQYKSAFVVDQEINTAACILEIMAQSVWVE